ncbi:AAA family ATPase [Candidatus Micrarchaeota archaeon]|nr:AAA family ATPase [Candidatus Micrarchaeota archaeon]
MNYEQVLGNEEAKDEILKWALDWDRGKKNKPLLIVGPVGVGKTAIINALIEKMGWNKVEIYREDLSDEKKLKPLTQPGKTLLGTQSIFVIEDVDAMYSKRDVTKIKKYFESIEHPLILTGISLWDQVFAEVRNYCLKIELKKINSRSLKSFLEKQADEKNFNKENIPFIIESSNGDVRSALIDLENESFGQRERESDVFKELLKVFKHGFDDAMTVNDSIDYDLFVAWVEENIPAEYESPEEVAKAFDWLSKSSVFKGRIFNRQYYTLMRYLKPLALGGVAISKKQKYAKFTRYQFPSIIKKLGESKKNRALLKSIGKKVSAKTHSSTRIGIATSRLTGITQEAAAYYGLDEDEAKLITPSLEVLKNKKTNKRKTKS